MAGNNGVTKALLQMTQPALEESVIAHKKGIACSIIQQSSE